MIPTKNNNHNGCDPISSNCVIWQGPDIPCIDLCNGDTVSEVVAKLAEKVCELIDATCECNPELSIDPSCLVVADPTNLDQVLQAIIDLLCAQKGGDGEAIIVVYPECLREGDIVQAPIQDYVVVLANKICEILTQLTILQNAIVDLTSRVTILENCVLPCSPSTGNETNVISSCIIQGGQEVPVSTLLLALETAFCSLRNVVGTVAQVNTAIGTQCIFANTPMLSGSGTYGGIQGGGNGFPNPWVANANTLAGANQNQWLVLCDLYNAVQEIQDNCCSTGCTDVTFGYTHSISTSSGTGQVSALVLNFTSSQIPAGFSDCGGSTLVTITDSNGSQIQQPVNITNLSTDPAGATISLVQSGLNLNNALNVSIPFCVNSGDVVCQDTQQFTVPLGLDCPASVSLSPTTSTVLVSFQNITGPNMNFNIDLVLNGVTVQTGIINNANLGLVSYTFSGLTQGTSYDVVVTVTDSSGQSTTCQLGSVTTLGQSCTDAETIVVDTAAEPPTSVYVGYRGGQGETPLYHFYYDAFQNKIYKRPAFGDCRDVGPRIDNYSMTVGGAATFDLTDGNPPTLTSMTYSFSTDGYTWGGTTSVVGDQFGILLNTGVTSGQVYIRALGVCAAGNTLYSIVKYDFNTNVWVKIQQPGYCPVQYDNYPTCPTGQLIGDSNTLTCNNKDYTVPNDAGRGRWYYVGKLDVGGTIKYLFCGWNSNDGVAKAVLCCECPAYIDGPNTVWEVNGKEVTGSIMVPAGGSVDITIPYVLGGGTAEMSIIQTPQFGVLTQVNAGSNVFTYTPATGTPAPGDTFEVQITSTVQGECTSASAIIPIQIIQGPGGSIGAKSYYMFVDTSSFLATDADKIKGVKDATKAKIQTDCPDWTGDIFLIPVTSDRWLGYAKSVIDDGASASLNPGAEWVAARNLPGSWTGGANDKSDVTVLVMSNASAGQYHDNTLAQGWGAFPNAQATTQYLDDYETYMDIQLGTEVSAWAQEQGFDGDPPVENGLKLIYLPITADTGASNAAAILQGLGSLVAEMINPREYGIETAVDVTYWTMAGVAPSMTNPYKDAVTTGGVSVEGLIKNNVNMILNQPLNGSSMSDYLDAILKGEDPNDLVAKISLVSRGSGGDCVDPAPGDLNIRLTKCGEDVILDIVNTGSAISPGDVVKVDDICYTASDVEPEAGVAKEFEPFDDCELCKASIAVEE